MKTPKVTESKDIFVVYQNTDSTEGRGKNIPIYYCELKTTAERCSKKRGVMGSDADFWTKDAFKINGEWYGPISIELPSLEDTNKNKKNLEKEVILNKIKDLGITEEEIKKLFG